MKKEKMDLKKIENKYVICSLPKYKKLSSLKHDNNSLDVPLTKCGNEIIDRLEIIPYSNEIEATKTTFNIFYFDVETAKKFRIEIKYIISNKGLFKNKEIKKYWQIKVYKISKIETLNNTITDEHYFGSYISWEIEKILGVGKLTKKNIIDFLLKFNYTKYTRNRNILIGGVDNV